MSQFLHDLGAAADADAAGRRCGRRRPPPPTQPSSGPGDGRRGSSHGRPPEPPCPAGPCLASAMSLTVISPRSQARPRHPRRTGCRSPTSRIRLHAALARSVRRSMPACTADMFDVFDLGADISARRDSSTPKCCKTKQVSRLICPAQRASYRPYQLPRFFSQA